MISTKYQVGDMLTIKFGSNESHENTQGQVKRIIQL